MKGYIDSIFNNTPYTFEMTGCARLRAARSDAQIDLTGGDGMPRRCKGDITPGRHRCSGIDIPAYYQPLLQGMVCGCKPKLDEQRCEFSYSLRMQLVEYSIVIMSIGPQEKLITAQICGTAVEVALHQACLPANGGFHHVTVQDATTGKILARQPVPDGGSNASATYQTHLIFDMAGSDVVMKLQVLLPLSQSVFSHVLIVRVHICCARTTKTASVYVLALYLIVVTQCCTYAGYEPVLRWQDHTQYQCK
jgi:hypothetical protein